MTKVKHLFVGLLMFVSIGTSVSQSKNAAEDKAYEALNNEEYVKAYDLFSRLHKQSPSNMDYELKLGIACLGYPGKTEQAIDIFKNLSGKLKTPDAEFQLGRAYHINYRFDEAIAVLQPLINALSGSEKKEDKSMVEDSKLIIMQCQNAKEIIKNPTVLKVTNLGSPINTNELEAVPVITADESMMIYTYRGRKSIGGRMDNTLQPDPAGAYTSDIYMSWHINDSVWQMPTPIKALNTKANDAAIALSPNGRVLFTFMSTNENAGDIYMSLFNGKEFSKPIPLNSNINSPSWEGSCSISADGKILYFSSERPGGLGGRDIWMSELVDGDWGVPTNLGPTINTPYDDDDPFIHPDGITLFFSSKGHTSMGGYDIMFSTKQADGTWSEALNMGLPVNTTVDDRYYVINSRGDRGYFSSNRAVAGSMGSQDIYTVTPGVSNPQSIVLALHKGVIYGDGQPVEARIEIINTTNSENVGTFYSNISSGKYFVTLKPGTKYHVKISAEGYEPYEAEVDLASLSVYMEKKKDVHLFSKEYAAANPEKVQQAKEEEMKADAEAMYTITKVTEPVKEETGTQEQTNKTTEVAATKSVQEKITQQPVSKSETKITEPAKTSSPCNGNSPDLSSIKGKSLNDPEVYKRLMNIAGDFCSEGVVFKVQIGAYRHPENFKYMNLKNLGEVETSGGVDGITRFTQKQFNVLKEAEKHRQKAIAKGQKDAWIVVFVNGQRYTLEDFIMADFLSKPIN